MRRIESSTRPSAVAPVSHARAGAVPDLRDSGRVSCARESAREDYAQEARRALAQSVLIACRANEVVPVLRAAGGRRSAVRARVIEVPGLKVEIPPYLRQAILGSTDSTTGVAGYGLRNLRKLSICARRSVRIRTIPRSSATSRTASADEPSQPKRRGSRAPAIAVVGLRYRSGRLEEEELCARERAHARSPSAQCEVRHGCNCGERERNCKGGLSAMAIRRAVREAVESCLSHPRARAGYDRPIARGPPNSSAWECAAINNARRARSVPLTQPTA